MKSRKSVSKAKKTKHSAAEKEAAEMLAKSPLKVTKGRVAILSLLMEEHGPFRIEEIHSKLIDTGLDLVTVYRNLSSMEELGLVIKVTMDDSVARYELVHGHGHHHHHIMCTSCRKIESFDDCIVEALDAKVAKMGYKQVRHSLEFFGICKSCS